MKQLLTSQRTFARFMLTYISIVILMVLLFIPLYRDTLRIVHDNMTEKVRADMVQGLTLLEDELVSLQTIAQKLTSQQDFILAQSLNGQLQASDYVTLQRANKYLKDVTATLRLSSDVFVMFEKNHQVLSNQRIYINSDESFDYFSKFSDMDFTQLYELLFSRTYYKDFIASRPYRDISGERDVIAYLLSMPLMSEYTKHSVIMAVMPVDKIIELLRIKNLEHIAVIEIKDSSGQTIYRNGSTKPLPEMEPDVVSSIRFNNRDYTFYKSIGNSTGISLQAGIPSNYYTGLLKPVSSKFYIYMIVVVLLGSAVSLFFTILNVNPIQRLVSSFSRLNLRTAQFERTGYRNDFQYIEAAMRSIRDDSLNIQQENQSLKETVFNKLFEKLLNTGLTAQEMEQFSRLYPDFPNEYRLAVFETSSPGSLYETLIRQEKGPSHVFMHANKVLAFLKAGQTGVKEIRALFRAVLDANRETTVAVSTSFVGTDSVCNAYKQAMYMARFLEGEKMIFADEAPNHSYYINVKENQKLYDLLLAGDSVKARQIVYRQWYELSMLPYPDDRIENLFYAQLGILSSAILHIKTAIHLPVYNDQLSISQLAFTIGEKAEELCSFVQSRRMQYDEKMNEDLVAYVNEHCFKENFTLNILESIFSLSLKTLSKQFREQTGMNLSDYVEERRLEKAERLLRENSLNVNEIAAECGFGSQNTLYKAFKRVHGVSPSVYRNNYIKQVWNTNHD